jgi:hypothetical protein
VKRPGRSRGLCEHHLADDDVFCLPAPSSAPVKGLGAGKQNTSSSAK